MGKPSVLKKYPYYCYTIRACILIFVCLISNILCSQTNLLDSLKSKLNKKQTDTNQANLLIKIGRTYARLLDYDSALYFYEKANTLSTSIPSPKHQVNSLIQIASTHFILGNYDTAGTLFNAALTISKPNHFEAAESKIYLNLANVQYLQGNLGESLISSDKALKYFIKINDIRGQSHCYTNIGNVYAALKSDDKKVLENYLTALRLTEKLKDNRMLVGAYCNVGSAYGLLTQNKNAVNYYELGLKKAFELKDTLLISTIYSNMGSLYFYDNILEKAMQYYMEAEKYGIAAKNDHKLANVYFGFCQTLIQSRNIQRARDYGIKALKLAEATGNREIETEALQLLSTIETKLSNYKQALSYLQEHNKLKDSLFGNETIQKIEQAAAKAKYEATIKLNKIELEKKQALLVSENQIKDLELTRSYLISSIIISILVFTTLLLILFFRQKRVKIEEKNTFLEQKALRAQMNPHFLFNSLNSIQRMFMEGKTELANDTVADFSKLLRNILNNSSLSLISLGEEINTLKLYIDIERIRCDNSFDYGIEVDEKIDLRYIKVPPLIIQPFVENAIWHGILPNKQKGIITIKFKLSDNAGFLECEINDNGIGIDFEKLNNSNSKGIQITEKRIGVKPVFRKNKNGGTNVTLKISI